jgi:hypothetical protein
MGQAKKRGTYEERVAQAQLCNSVVAKLIRESKNDGLANLVRTHGLQAVTESIRRTNNLGTLAEQAKEATAAQESGPRIITPPGYDDGWWIVPTRRRSGSIQR